MSVPFMAPRMKETDDLLRLRIDAAKVRATAAITRKAAKREIRRAGRTFMLARRDMIHFERQLIVRLRHLTVFATTAGAFPDELAKSGMHERLTRSGCGA